MLKQGLVMFTIQATIQRDNFLYLAIRADQIRTRSDGHLAAFQGFWVTQPGSYNLLSSHVKLAVLIEYLQISGTFNDKHTTLWHEQASVFFAPKLKINRGPPVGYRLPLATVALAQLEELS